MSAAKVVITILGGVAGFVAAGLWLKATRVSVPVPTKAARAAQGWAAGATVQYGNSDALATAALQTKWNGYAAVATAIAVVIQTVASMVP